jgi:hypothetical protein
MSAIEAYEKLVAKLTAEDGVTASQMFGKACLKISGKAFLAQHLDCVVFKLTGKQHEKAMGLPGAKLWDPSGKGRAMKEWVAVPTSQVSSFAALAKAAMAYVSESA